MGLFNRRKTRDDDEPVDPDARSPQLGIKYKDLLLMGQLVDRGAALDQPRHVIHFSYFPSRDAAVAAGEELRPHGWLPEVHEHDGQWSLVCDRHDAVLEPGFVRETTDLFEAVAARHGGEHDGWEAAV